MISSSQSEDDRRVYIISRRRINTRNVKLTIARLPSYCSFTVQHSKSSMLINTCASALVTKVAVCDRRSVTVTFARSCVKTK